MNKISKREKVLLVVLCVLVVVCAYYLFFLTPTMETKAQLETEITAMDDQVIATQARVAHMNKMQQDLEVIKAENKDIKDLPAYDNNKKLMESLNMMLGQAAQYTVNFSGTSETDGIIRREVDLSFVCYSYNDARAILQQIHDGVYPCVLQDLSINHGESYSVTATLTFFEYLEQ